MQSRSRGGAPVAAVLCALILLTLSSSLVGGKVLSSGDNIFLWPPFSAERPAQLLRPSNPILTDPVVGFTPDLLKTRTDLRNGVLPIWNPDAGAGRPLLASLVHAPLFPLTWLAFLLPFWTSLAWIAAAKLLLAAAGLYLFCRELGLRRAPSLLGAVTFAFGSYFFVWLEHPQTYVWLVLPWMFLAARRVSTRGGFGAAALLGAAAGLSSLGGHPESTALSLLATAAYGAFELLAERRAGQRPRVSLQRHRPETEAASRTRRAVLLIGGLGLGVAVSAIANAPFYELLKQAGPTNRGGPSLPLSAIYSFTFPELWGMPTKLFSGTGPSNFNERTAYLGALPTLLAFGALGRRRPREQWFMAAMAAVTLLAIFDFPVIAKLVRALPGGKVVGLTRLLFLVSFAGSVLAAYGLQRWMMAQAGERRQMLRIMAAAALLPLLVWLVRNASTLSHLGAALGQLPSVHPSQTNQNVVALGSVWRWALLCGLGLGGLALIGRRRWPTLAVAVLALGLTSFDLIALDRGYHPAVPLARVAPPVPSAIRFLNAHQGNGRVTGSNDALPANLGSEYGLRDARVAIDVPYPLRYRLLWTGLGGIGGDQEVFVANAPGAQRLADVFAVRYVLLTPGEHAPSWLRPVLSTSGGTVTVNPSALPRAWVAYGWRPARTRSDALARTLASSAGTLRERPVIEGARAAPAGPAPASTVARILHEGSETIKLDATATRPGYLILDDSAYPGWQASLDGHTVPWAPANENFRAVEVPAGHHVLSYSYRPASLLAGAIVSALSVLALLALGCAAVLVASRGRRERTLSEREGGPA